MYSRNFRYERGQVFFLQEGHAYGAEIMSGRPVLIISEQGHLDALPTAIVASLSRTVRNWESVVPVETDSGTSNVICNQLKTVDKGRLTKFMRKLTDEEMLKVDEALRHTLNLGAIERSYDEEYERDFEMDMCQVEVAEPVDISVAESNDNELLELKAELAMYKKLYEKAIDKLVDLKFEKDTTVVKVTPVVEKHELSETEILEAIDKLEKEPEKVQKRGRPPKKEEEVKMGRPKTQKVSWKAKREDILQYANKSGKTNVNTDPWYVIAATTGMNLNTAQNIVAYRNKHGRFIDLVDLLNVSKFSISILDKYGRMLEV